MKTYKYILAFFALAISLSASLHAQNNSKKDEIEAMKSAFITRRLNLTPDEAKTFWPVYNQCQNDLEVLRKRHRTELANARMNFDQLSDKELEKIVDGEVIFRQGELDVMKKYLPQFKQVLSIRKVAMLYKAEEEFKRELLKRIREKQE